MSGSSLPARGSEREGSGALDELLSTEREIAEQFARADEDATRILDDAQAQIALRRATSSEKLRQAIAELESEMRATAAAEESDARDRTAALVRRFDDATDAQIDLLADAAVLRLFGVARGVGA